MGILEGKNILVTGVTMRTSIAYAAVEIAQREGANVVVSAAGRAVAPATRAISKLDPAPPIVEVDVTNPEHLAALPDLLGEHFEGGLDGIVHSIAYADPEKALGGAFLTTDWDSVGNALHISAYSLQSLTMAAKPILNRGASVVGLTFDARVSWPTYDWMGVAKAALESTSRYLARYLGPDGIRCNLVAAGPVDTVAKKAIPGASAFNDIWAERAPLSWDASDAVPSAKAIVALLSDWFPATTGEMIHVDGGLHSTGA
jgi:enoyl-[acyl-carrier protein] reductase I